MKKLVFPIVLILTLFAFVNAAQATVYIGDGEIIAVPDPTLAQSTPKPATNPTGAPSAAVAASEETVAPVNSETPEETPTPELDPTPDPIPTPTPAPSLEPVEPFDADYSEPDEEAKTIVLDFVMDTGLGASAIEIKGNDDFREILLLDDEGTARVSVPIDEIESLSFIFTGQSELAPKDVLDDNDPDEYKPKGQSDYEGQEIGETGNGLLSAQGLFIIAVIASVLVFLIYSRVKKSKGNDKEGASKSADKQGVVDMEAEEKAPREKGNKRPRRADKAEKAERKKAKRFSFSRTDASAGENDPVSELLSAVRSKCTRLSIGIAEDDNRCELACEIDNGDGLPDALHCALNLDKPEETDVERRLANVADFLEKVQSGEIHLTRADLLRKESSIPGLSHSMTDENGEIQYIFWF